jgi:hypothetical protein
LIEISEDNNFVFMRVTEEQAILYFKRKTPAM